MTIWSAADRHDRSGESEPLKTEMLATLLGGLLIGCATSAPPSAPPSATEGGSTVERDARARRFHVRYVTTLPDLPPGAPLRLWIPVPSDDAHQRISDLVVDSPWPWRLTREAAHGNRMLYVEAEGAPAGATVSLEYDVERLPRREDLAAAPGADDPEAMAPYLRETRLVRVDDRLRGIADDLARDRPGVVDLARAFYEHVRAEMTYDKSGEGWGRGDSLFACDARRGNCTDFHAYFMALCLAREIPTRFEVGLFGPYERRPGEELEVGGYHCWAEFRLPGRAWIPVDISEADKDPARADALFGGLTDNRVTLSAGRDLTLAPAQAGEPINFFVAPYAEVDGRPFEGVTRTTSWRDAAER